MNRSLVALAIRLLPFLVPVVVACIEVGHDAETGCLVDQSAPGCRANGRGGTSSGGTGSGGTSGRGGSTATGGVAPTGGTGAEAGAAGANPEAGAGGA
jgi:hypothetical protein